MKVRSVHQNLLQPLSIKDLYSAALGPDTNNGDINATKATVTASAGKILQ